LKTNTIFYSIIASFLGVGYFPIAPATVASGILCIIIWFFLRSTFIYIGTLIILFPISVWVSTKAEKYWGKDSRKIVIDEVIGMLITLLFIPRTILFFGTGFILFRFFDIVKPFPIGHLQDFSKGWGVVMDDVIAGMYSGIILWIIVYFYYFFMIH